MTERIIEPNKEFKKKYNLISSNDELLRKPLENFDFKNPPVDPEELARELVGHMRYYGGIGVSANQLGLPYRVFTMEGDPAFVCFNPRITAFAGDSVKMDEGCLSYPGLYVKKERPEIIRCRFFTPNGNSVVKKFTGMTARIFQHEMEHMNGENFLEGIGPLELDFAKKRQQKLLRKVQKQRKQLKKMEKAGLIKQKDPNES